ncbi:elongation factor EF-2 [Candidatus Woesearchaeota archaeon]|nr:elongation factor EF-2 [Candidatus Woesearchaeota archaeon]
MGEKMVDKVKRLVNKPEQIRNIAICAHIDHGKTTFSDNLLAGAGMMSEELAGKALQLDFHEDEQERGITIDTAAVNMVHSFEDKEYLINLLDTPGHVDFGGDVTRAMRASDGAIVLCCAVEGTMPQTETVLKQALREKVKPILFINKVDRLIKELKLSPEKMQERFMDIIKDVNKFIEQMAPEEHKQDWQVSVKDGTVAFGSSFHNWALSINYMQNKGITFKDIIEAYQEGEKWRELGKKAPLHEVVLNMVIRHLPNPKEAQKGRIPAIWHGDKDSALGKSLINCDPNGPLVFMVTKVVIDPQAGEIAAGRLFSGTIKRGQEVYLNLAKKDSRVQQVYIYNGAKREIVDDIPPGNFIGVGGLKGAYPGETVSVGKIEPMEKITHIFEPVVTKAIEAKKPSDLPKLIDVLVDVSKEDPSIEIEINKETGEHLMSGMGELHLEVIENRIKKEKGVDIETSPPIVVYRESVTKISPQTVEGKSPNKHNKFYFKVEPLNENIIKAIKEGELPEGRIKKEDKETWKILKEKGMDGDEAKKVRDIYKGNVFIDATRGIVHIGEIIEMVLDMFEDVMKKGPLCREPCFGVKAIFEDVKLHEDAIHRGPAQVYPAVRSAIKMAITISNPVLFEPVQTLRFEAPVEYMGELSNIISSKRGKLEEMDQKEKRIKVIGKLPVAEMFGLSSELRSATEGRGSFSLIDQKFEKMPGNLQEDIITRIRERKGLGPNE